MELGGRHFDAVSAPLVALGRMPRWGGTSATYCACGLGPGFSGARGEGVNSIAWLGGCFSAWFD